LTGNVNPPEAGRILDGTTTLVVFVRFSYKGYGGKVYSYGEEYRWDPQLKGFVTLGPPKE
jgi:hypothetical protein